jgi:hypothetical protein
MSIVLLQLPIPSPHLVSILWTYHFCYHSFGELETDMATKEDVVSYIEVFECDIRSDRCDGKPWFWKRVDQIQRTASPTRPFPRNTNDYFRLGQVLEELYPREFDIGVCVTSGSTIT